jgi:hypothetical protein
MATPSISRRRGSPVVHRAREVLASFLFTFIAARVLVYLIMARRISNMYAHVGGTHVHHLNYGIFLLTFVGAYLLFGQPRGTALSLTSIIYGIAIGLTFDEFGMWLHLDTTYWQRASFDAVVVIAAVLGLVSAAPEIRRFHPRHWITAILVLAFLGGFAWVLVKGANDVGRRVGPSLQRLEESGPSES